MCYVDSYPTGGIKRKIILLIREENEGFQLFHF